MFAVADRQRVHDRILELAASDARVVAGAVVGSLALGKGDAWSDLDLAFAVSDDIAVSHVLDDWTREIVTAFDAAHLFDLASGPSVYRVFLLPGCLQFDLSFTPASAFGATSPRFRLLFGHTADRPHVQPPDAAELFGHAVHHAVRARVCIERNRFWQARYWIDELRNCGLSLACRRRGLPARYARGFDDLPANVHAAFARSWVTTLGRDDLLRALAAGVAALMAESDEAGAVTQIVAPRLRELIQA